MLRSLVGSEMCIRDRNNDISIIDYIIVQNGAQTPYRVFGCLLVSNKTPWFYIRASPFQFGPYTANVVKWIAAESTEFIDHSLRCSHMGRSIWLWLMWLVINAAYKLFIPCSLCKEVIQSWGYQIIVYISNGFPAKLTKCAWVDCISTNCIVVLQGT